MEHFRETSQGLLDILVDPTTEATIYQSFLSIIDTWEKWIESEGKGQAVKRIKQLNHFFMATVIGESIEYSSDNQIWFKTTDKYTPCPKLYQLQFDWVREMDLDITETNRRLSICLSILSSVDLLEGTPNDLQIREFKEKTETQCSLSEQSVKAFKEFLDILDRESQHGLWKDSYEPEIQLFHNFSVSTGIYQSLASGPSGFPAVLSTHRDFVKLYTEHRTLWEKLKSFSEGICKVSKITGIQDSMSDWELWWDSLTTQDQHNLICECNYPISKVVQLPASAGKVRNIAIVDYFTQHVMSPIHDHLMSYLKRLTKRGTDGTYDQIGAVSRLSSRIISGLDSTGDPRGKIYFSASYDQSSCTEYFPVRIQRLIIEKFLGEDLSNLWRSILVDRSFKSLMSDGSYLDLRWTKGQPLGALSSWAAMAVSHHMMVQFAAYKSGVLRQFSKGLFTDYCVLGDDIVILNRAVALQYESLCKEWGMKINHSKSHVTIKTNQSGVLVTEFAKRILVDGINVPILRAKQVKEVLKSQSLSSYIVLLKQVNEIRRVTPKMVRNQLNKLFPNMDYNKVMYVLSKPQSLGGLDLKVYGSYQKSIIGLGIVNVPDLLLFSSLLIQEYNRLLKRFKGNYKTSLNLAQSSYTKSKQARMSKLIDEVLNYQRTITTTQGKSKVHRSPFLDCISMENAQVFGSKTREMNNLYTSSIMQDYNQEDLFSQDPLFTVLNIISYVSDPGNTTPGGKLGNESKLSYLSDFSILLSVGPERLVEGLTHDLMNSISTSKLDLTGKLSPTSVKALMNNYEREVEQVKFVSTIWEKVYEYQREMEDYVDHYPRFVYNLKRLLTGIAGSVINFDLLVKELINHLVLNDKLSTVHGFKYHGTYRDRESLTRSFIGSESFDEFIADMETDPLNSGLIGDNELYHWCITNMNEFISKYKNLTN